MNLKRNEFINLKGELETGLNKNEHAREISRLRKRGYSLEKIQTITGVKSY